MSDVAYDSDDFAGYVLILHIYRDLFAERILIRKILLDQCLADDHHVGLSSVLLTGKQATLPKRNPHGAKIIRFDHADVGAEFVFRRGGSPLDRETCSRADPGERQRTAGAGRFNAGQRFDSLE